MRYGINSPGAFELGDLPESGHRRAEDRECLFLRRCLRANGVCNGAYQESEAPASHEG